MIKPQLSILGLGSRSTLFYLKELNRQYNNKKGGFCTCPFILLNTDFNKINSLLPYVSKELDEVVKKYLREIEKHDSQHLLIPNITLHETIERLPTNKNIIHPVYLSIQKITENSWHKIVLFGSIFSMKSEYVKGKFKANGIEVILPSEDDMLFIDEVRKHIYNETETKEIIDNYHLLIKKYAKNNPVLIACTELSILKPTDQINLIDMAQVQIEEALKLILN